MKAAVMQDFEWCLLDTETTGLRAPIFVVEIAAQRMRGWDPVGEPFRRIVNHGVDIPPEAARVHGYTREILERDGDPPDAVYRDFARYAEGVPLAAYNLSYDWDEVLIPEWQRLGLDPVGSRGLCMLELARRLLDPVPAGNCKLQTLRQYYRLPSRGAHTALGDVETVVDLLQRVLRPLCEARALLTYSAIDAFCGTEWFPSRIPFGKFKGRLFREAREDAELRNWLHWLMQSSSDRSRAMGAWYLAQLERPASEASIGIPVPGETSLVLHVNPDAARLRLLVEQARNFLADLEAEYTTVRQAVAATQAKLFQLLREQYRERDLLRLRLDLRKKYLRTLMMEGEEAAERVEEERAEAEERLDQEYERTARETEGQRELTDDEAAEMKQLWRKLVKLFHPDRLGDDPERQAIYVKLTAEINRARDEGNIALLREIAQDPEGFIAKQGWGFLQSKEIDDVLDLERLHEGLQSKIFELLAALDEFKASSAFELHLLLQSDAARFDAVVAEYRASLDGEIRTLLKDLDAVESELASLES